MADTGRDACAEHTSLIALGFALTAVHHITGFATTFEAIFEIYTLFVPFVARVVTIKALVLYN